MTGNVAVPVLQCARDWIDYWTFVATAGGVLVVGVYTYLTYRQFRLTKSVLIETQRSNAATEESNRIAKHSLELHKRSWLVITNLVPPLAPNGGMLTSEVSLQNVGGVPGIVRRHGWGFVVVGNLPKEFVLDADHSKPNGMAVFGDVPRRADLRRTPDVDEREAATGLLRRGSYLYLYWIIEYWDCLCAEGQIRRTVQCWRSNDPERGWYEAPEPQCCRLE